MSAEKLKICETPKLTEPRLVMGFSGWMDGGEISTGTIKYLTEKLDAKKLAEINPEGFYIYNFPGQMEVTALFRPHTKIEDGLVRVYEPPTNEFFCSSQDNLILFLGKEPNLYWESYADCIFRLCERFGVKTMYFVGSVSGLVPHTREPRLFCTASDPNLKDVFRHYGVSLTSYEGPAGIVTYLTFACAQRGLQMVGLVATVPAYVQGYNPKCIEAVTRRLAGMLELKVDLEELQSRSEDFEKKLDQIVAKQPDLAASIRKLEEDYDNEIFNNEMGDLKNWLQQQGISVD
jgi:proteasome assembly chaperone (PAC2) family protein